MDEFNIIAAATGGHMTSLTEFFLGAFIASTQYGEALRLQAQAQAEAAESADALKEKQEANKDAAGLLDDTQVRNAVRNAATSAKPPPQDARANRSQQRVPPQPWPSPRLAFISTYTSIDAHISRSLGPHP